MQQKENLKEKIRTKLCPCCGGTIKEEAIKCKHCKTMINTEMLANQDVYLKTEELTFFKKLAQMYWLHPKSTRLDEFILENEVLTIKTKSGKIIQSDLSKIISKYTEDKGNYVFYIQDENGNKLKFNEVPFTLSDEDWELIKSILPLEESKMQKVNKVLEWFS